MKRIHYPLILLAIVLITSCEKELSLEGYQPPPVVIPPVIISEEDQFRELIDSQKFQLRGFYSDVPVDYIENDSLVKEETDLWKYVSHYLKDDINTFYTSGNVVTIEQNAQKMPGLSDPILNRNYLIGTDADGVYMRFLDYQYNPLEYRLHKMTDEYFILSIKWRQGATLFSRFEKLL